MQHTAIVADTEKNLEEQEKNFDVLKYPFYNSLIFKLVFQFRVLLFC